MTRIPKGLEPESEHARRQGELERRLQKRERTTPDFREFHGPRSDLPGGRGRRVRVGLLSDGSYGVERWTETGTRQTVTWS